MIAFFKKSGLVYAVQTADPLTKQDVEKLTWLFGDAECVAESVLTGTWTGPRKEMITPWSTNAVEITQNMGIKSITRIEEFRKAGQGNIHYDPMLEHVYPGLDQQIFHIKKEPDPIILINDIPGFNLSEGLALSDEEVEYLEDLSEKIGRMLTDSEVFGFSQVNSEHCRHKIFNGTFIINGQEMPESLFSLIRKTSKEHPNFIVSAYKDNVAFILGPVIEQFAPETQNKPDFFVIKVGCGVSAI